MDSNAKEVPTLISHALKCCVYQNVQLILYGG